MEFQLVVPLLVALVVALDSSANSPYWAVVAVVHLRFECTLCAHLYSNCRICKVHRDHKENPDSNKSSHSKIKNFLFDLPDAYN